MEVGRVLRSAGRLVFVGPMAVMWAEPATAQISSDGETTCRNLAVGVRMAAACYSNLHEANHAIQHPEFGPKNRAGSKKVLNCKTLQAPQSACDLSLLYFGLQRWTHSSSP